MILAKNLTRTSNLKSLFAALCLGRVRPFLMLATYADETGHHADPQRRFVGIAGFLGHSDKWNRFDAEWRQACHEEGVKEPFHMVDFAASREQFESWKDDEVRRKRLLGRLVAAIKNAEVYPIGAVVPIEDFNSLTEAQRISLGSDPYYVAFQAITHQMAFAGALMSYPPEPIPMVYARLKGYTGKAMELWDAIKEHNLYGFWMGSFTPGDPEHYSPLQAADLWAYELGAYWHDKNRWAFGEIVNHALKMAGGHKFFELCDKKFMLGALGELDETE